MQIGIVGLGLIGGSLAKAAKERTTHTVLGFDRIKRFCRPLCKAARLTACWNRTG